MKCPHCGKEINAASIMGAATSEKKKISSRENGKKGGRPRLQKQQNKSEKK